MIDDATLLKMILNPETQNSGFRELVCQYQKPLYFHIRSIVLNHDDADDVLQNTFIKIFKGISGFKEESKLFTWMYRIATNESLTFLALKAKKNHITSQELLYQITENLEADVYFEGDAIELKLQKAVHLLPEKQQLVFKMKYFDDLTYEAISEILGTSVGALKSSYHHAIKKLENILTQN